MCIGCKRQGAQCVNLQIIEVSVFEVCKMQSSKTANSYSLARGAGGDVRGSGCGLIHSNYGCDNLHLLRTNANSVC
jgi:hypothetical protein